MTPRSLAPVHLALLLLAGGCVWTPANRSTAESSAAVSMTGYVSAASAAVSIQARNWDTGAFEVVTSTIASSSASFTSPEMYSWSKSVSLAPKFWAPQQAGCAGGRAQIRVFEGGNQLETFTSAAQTCVSDKIYDGLHPAGAGNECSDGEEVVLFDNNGVCGGAETGGLNPVKSGTAVVDGRSITWQAVSYPVQGNTIYGLICRPNDAVRHPVQVYNHGGWYGLYPDEFNGCLLQAARGWVVAMSTYRGERLYLNVIDQWLSGGSIELCQGEVTDVLRLTNLVLAQPYAEPSRVLMYGLSHGGCVTTRAVQRGAPVQAAIDVAGPSEWASLYYNLGWWYVYKTPTSPMTQTFTSLMALWIGVPSVVPHAYEWRSSKFVAEDLAARTDVKYLRIQGALDNIVPPDHACKLAKAAYGASGSKNWHFNTGAGVITTAPAGCTTTDATLTWQAGPKPTTSWPDNRYLFVYDGLNHVIDGSTPPAIVTAYGTDLVNFTAALGWGV